MCSVEAAKVKCIPNMSSLCRDRRIQQEAGIFSSFGMRELESVCVRVLFGLFGSLGVGSR